MKIKPEELEAHWKHTKQVRQETRDRTWLMFDKQFAEEYLKAEKRYFTLKARHEKLLAIISQYPFLKWAFPKAVRAVGLAQKVCKQLNDKCIETNTMRDQMSNWLGYDSYRALNSCGDEIRQRLPYQQQFDLRFA